MGRPKPSDEVREFSAAFARAVTASSQNRYDWVARVGKYSIYSLLSLVVPKVCCNVQFFAIFCARNFASTISDLNSYVEGSIIMESILG